MIKRFRAMTWRQRTISILMTIVLAAAYKGLVTAAGWFAAWGIHSTSQSGAIGFILGIFFGALAMPPIGRWYNAAFRRLGGPNRTAAAK